MKTFREWYENKFGKKLPLYLPSAEKQHLTKQYKADLMDLHIQTIKNKDHANR